MSLVVCSNNDSDRLVSSQSQSIYKPYSWRNDLSSTLTLPMGKNGTQVALQSAKYNLDGSVSLGFGDLNIYQYFGEELDSNGSTMDDSTAYPILTRINDTEQIVDYDIDELRRAIQDGMNKQIYHPNLMELCKVEIKRDATTSEFVGYKYIYEQYLGTDRKFPESARPTFDFLTSIGAEEPHFLYDDTDGTFVTEQVADDRVGYECVATFGDKPISNSSGAVVFDISDCNSAGIEWAVGLSRNETRFDEFDPNFFVLQPEYFDPMQKDPDDDQNYKRFFYDYLVARNGNELLVYHTPANSEDLTEEDDGRDFLRQQQFDYVNASGDFTAIYDLNTNASRIEKIGFQVFNQTLEITAINGSGQNFVIYRYDQTLAKQLNLKPINQCTWQMFPLAYIESSDSTYGNEIIVADYRDCENLTSSYDNIADSWYYKAQQTDAHSIEKRPWNDYSTTITKTLTYSLCNASGKILHDNVFITKPSDLYKPTFGANGNKLMGIFSPAVFDNASTSANILESEYQPKLVSSRTMFLRLNNFTNQSTNAHTGNKSSIIAQLPRFDGQVETGRIFHEPSNLIFLDLGNTAPIKINSFDLSFCYSNEQYVTALTGQSVVCLYFRAKD